MLEILTGASVGLLGVLIGAAIAMASKKDKS